jgi:hypothetical protein
MAPTQIKPFPSFLKMSYEGNAIFFELGLCGQKMATPEECAGNSRGAKAGKHLNLRLGLFDVRKHLRANIFDMLFGPRRGGRGTEISTCAGTVVN